MMSGGKRYLRYRDRRRVVPRHRGIVADTAGELNLTVLSARMARGLLRPRHQLPEEDCETMTVG